MTLIGTITSMFRNELNSTANPLYVSIVKYIDVARYFTKYDAYYEMYDKNMKVLDMAMVNAIINTIKEKVTDNTISRLNIAGKDLAVTGMIHNYIQTCLDVYVDSAHRTLSLDIRGYHIYQLKFHEFSTANFNGIVSFTIIHIGEVVIGLIDSMIREGIMLYKPERTYDRIIHPLTSAVSDLDDQLYVLDNKPTDKESKKFIDVLVKSIRKSIKPYLKHALDETGLSSSVRTTYFKNVSVSVSSYTAGRDTVNDCDIIITVTIKPSTEFQYQNVEDLSFVVTVGDMITSYHNNSFDEMINRTSIVDRIIQHAVKVVAMIKLAKHA